MVTERVVAGHRRTDRTVIGTLAGRPVRVTVSGRATSVRTSPNGHREIRIDDALISLFSPFRIDGWTPRVSRSVSAVPFRPTSRDRRRRTGTPRQLDRTRYSLLGPNVAGNKHTTVYYGVFVGDDSGNAGRRPDITAGTFCPHRGDSSVRGVIAAAEATSSVVPVGAASVSIAS